MDDKWQSCLSLKVLKKSIAVISFFAEKLLGAFALQKYSHFVGKNGSVFTYITFENLASR